MLAVTVKVMFYFLQDELNFYSHQIIYSGGAEAYH